MNWTQFKEKQIEAALMACEKHGYPQGDEPLCLLIEDSLEAAFEFLNDYDPTPCCYQHGVGALSSYEPCPKIADND